MKLATPLFLVTLTLQSLVPCSQGILGYYNISSPNALCNDFTRAGMLVKFSLSSGSSKKWVIFLESGGFCHSPDSCNRRFFRADIRGSGTNQSSNLLSEDFDLDEAWQRNKDRDLSEVISPLMTSTHRFRELIASSNFPNGQFVIDGRDILSGNCVDNPVFCGHNSVVLPYCSSDLWLGNDNRRFTNRGLACS